ncbi:DNA adenine methylase [Campylobacter lari]|nr:DNA adenine methylase [Campylobacter lari]EAI4304166.1 DNA adenine methylase [Campylobacter lari]EAJ5697664.1 DNA adenine methylase [Campylobacter lari]EAK0803103.1 DNA adenine methylase [Campylobacter lari]EAK0959046.1 DNA adenine methylase [Campylobacter lari]
MRFNDLNLNDWKNCDINTDSLWIISSRDKSGKHKNIYHGNFIPQIPYQLICRYTNRDDLVLDPFIGSGTTLYECEKLNRKCIGLDINENILEFILDNFGKNFDNSRYFLGNYDNTDKEKVKKFIEDGLKKINSKNCQFIILHPPYMDIIKFSDKKEDLSQISNINKFKEKFLLTCINTLQYLEKNRYFALVIGDLYKNSEIIPLGFELMNLIKQNFKVKVKGIVVKNIEGNRGKLGTNAIWRYRALRSDYYIFKHEYIFIFKKEF